VLNLNAANVPRKATITLKDSRSIKVNPADEIFSEILSRSNPEGG
jgi:hypothetical protein